MLRRLKSDVESLPEKTETRLFVGLSKLQATVYRNILQRNIDTLSGRHSPSSLESVSLTDVCRADMLGENRIKLMNTLMQVR
jgi:SNF2 family DNA or RNA helicase